MGATGSTPPRDCNSFGPKCELFKIGDEPEVAIERQIVGKLVREVHRRCTNWSFRSDDDAIVYNIPCLTYQWNARSTAGHAFPAAKPSLSIALALVRSCNPCSITSIPRSVTNGLSLRPTTLMSSKKYAAAK